MLSLTKLQEGISTQSKRVLRPEALFFASILILFIATSLLFARLPALLGIDAVVLWVFGGYEWPKTLWWYVWLCLSAPLALIVSRTAYVSKKILVLVCALMMILALHTQSLWDLFGTRFLPQGSLFIASLMVTAWILSSLQQHQRMAISRLLLGLSIPIWLYALLQGAGIDPVAQYYTLAPWQDSRPFSTFGSPNTLAVWCLLLMPLIAFARLSKRVQYALQVWLLITIACTQSLSVLALSLLYITVKAYRSADRGQKRIMLTLAIIVCIALALLVSTKGYVKYLSLSSRYEIWINMLQYLSPLNLSTWVGHGPGSLTTFFQDYRSASLGAFIAPHIPIDRAHNILLDMVWNWWLLGAGILGYFVKRLWDSSDRAFRAAILLFFATGCFHTPLLVHYLVVLLGVCSREKH